MKTPPRPAASPIAPSPAPRIFRAAPAHADSAQFSVPRPRALFRAVCALFAALVLCATPACAMEKIEAEDLEPYILDETETDIVLDLDGDGSGAEDGGELLADGAEDEEEAEKPITQIHGIDVPDTEFAQAMIKKFINQYTSFYGKKNLHAALERGEQYRLYIRTQLAERNMPGALEYLPVVESEFRTNAVSKVGAKGMWQFMENSMRPYLKKSVWLDERFDPWKSTDAALSKLEENYKIFGDWALAIAAYNCGNGAMTRALKSAEEKSFWYLAEHKLLKNETMLYVPKFLAACELCEHMDYYEVELPAVPEDAEAPEFEYVTVHEAISTALLATELEMDFAELKALNPALTKAVTPPGDEYAIRVPLGMGEQCALVVEEIKKKSPTAGLRTHVIVQGDTLWSLSRKAGCTVDDLCLLNNRKQTDILKIGDVLVVP